MTPYDKWKLASIGEDRPQIGTDDGQLCNRYPEPDEDQPRGYKPKRCDGVMNLDERDGMICCDTCGEMP